MASGHCSPAREPKADEHRGRGGRHLSAIVFKMSCPGSVESKSDFKPKERPSRPAEQVR